MLKGLLLLHLLTLAVPTMANASLYHAETTTVETQNSISIRAAHDEEEDVDYLDNVSARIDYNMLPEKKIFKTVYSDEIFFKPSTQYHHILAKQSCGMALAAFNLINKEPDQDPEGEGTLIDYFRQTGFSKFRFDDYNRETSMYTVASAIATKEIFYQDQSARLIAVAIRGGNYDKEWESNFNLGEGVRHQGFNEAATLVTDRILSYQATFTQDMPTKIWITGFSRAGAICNLVAANLNVTNTYTKEDIYAYSFAAPAAIRAEGVDVRSGFNNIFNIVGVSDLIPQFVPYEWGFARYGIDLQLTGAETDPTFLDKYKEVQRQIEALGGKTYYVPELNFRLRMLYGLLLQFSDNQQGFVELLQPVFISVIHEQNVNTLLEILRNTLIKYDKFSDATAQEKDAIIDFVLGFLQPILTGSSFMQGQRSSVVMPLLSVVHEHLPEMYLHLLYSYRAEDLFPDENNFDYIVLDQRNYTLIEKDTGKELLTIANGVKTLSQYALDNRLDYALLTHMSRPVLVLPHDRDYEVRYHLGQGEDLSCYAVPYGIHYISGLVKYELKVGAIAPRDGILAAVGPTSAEYAGTRSDYTPSQFTIDLGIDKLGVSYHAYIAGFGLIVALILIVILWLAVFLHSRIVKSKMRLGRLGIISLAIAAIVEAEIMFWFSSNLFLYNLLFKIAACLALLALYLLGKKPKEWLRIHKTILPSLLLFMASYVLASVNVYVTLGLAMAGGLYLSFYHLRLKRPKPYVWIIYAMTTALGVPLLTLFLGTNAYAICYLCFTPILLLVGFTAVSIGGQKQAASFLWVAQMVSFGVYLFSVESVFAASVLFTIFAGLSLALFVISYDKKDPSLIKEIEIAPAAETETEPNP